ncbi:MAG TPA: VTT domain-containing protein [Candidatus Paceibacterota bacterium]|nr:VTT domain-containing protein [Candidatus Paceibacterota bacterium]HRZ34670.1 VTT domain-containing protein [Candidatus Paceibacterota bacterium]
MLGNDKKEILRNLAGLIVIFLIIFVSFRFFNMDQVRDYIERAGLWAPVIFILAKASTIVFAPLSGSPLYPLAGVLFDPIFGFIYIVLGDALGATVSFYISRLFGRSFIEKFVRGDIQSVDKVLGFIEKKRGFLIARICFAALPEAISYAAGLTRIRFLTFFMIHNAVGLIPSAILVWSGAFLTTLTGNPLVILAIVIIGFVAAGAGAFLLTRFANEKSDPADHHGMIN